MTSSDELLKAPRTISKWSFECLVLVTIVLLSLADVFAALAVGRALGLPIEGALLSGLIALNVVLARFAVDGVLKRFGLSRSGKTVERRGRTVAIPEGNVGDDEVVEVSLPRSLARFVIWGCPLASVLGAAAGTLMLASDPWLAVPSYLLSGYFGLCAIHNWGDRKPQAWADQHGVTGYPSGLHLHRRFVPWSDVATCEIETFYGTFGNPVLVRPILKGCNGESLLALSLLNTKLEDQERLVNYIKAKLPKPKPTPEDEFWE
jgi:hypothetical protein